MDGLVLFGIFILLMLLNVPISFSLAISSIATMLLCDLPLDMVSMNMYSNIGKFLLMAIPFFVFAGNIMEKTGISRRLINLASACVGHIKGGTAIVCVLVSCFFAAISGSGPATVAALGTVLIPAMIKSGYNDATSSALMSTAGSIGIIIPPSISFVVYAAVADVSVTDMFKAGIIPGLIMGVALVIAILVVARKEKIMPSPKASGKERWKAFKDAFWGLLMPVIILGGIYGGIFTPTEAAAVAVVYGLIIGLVFYGELKLKDLPELFKSSIEGSASIMFIIASASLFAWCCTTTGVSKAATTWLQSVCHSQFAFLLVANVILLIAGCFIDANSAMYIFVPIMLPVVKALGYNPVAFGIVMTINLAIGLSTPPVGIDLFTACRVGNVSVKRISKAVIPFLIAQLAVLLLVTYVPSIIMFLPNLLTR